MLAAVLSSGLGGTSVAATRYLVSVIDPLAIGSFRFGIGFLLLLPAAFLQGGRWPLRGDWPGVAGLGVLYFAVFPHPVQRLPDFHHGGARRACPVDASVADDGRRSAARQRSPDDAQIDRRRDRNTRGRIGAAVWSFFGATRRLARRSPDGRGGPVHGALQHLVEALHCPRRAADLHDGLDGCRSFMPCADLVLARQLCARRRFRSSTVAGGSNYLGAFGSALTFYLWAFALERTTPTRVAISVTVNPITASLVGATLLDEPLRWNLVGGILTVFAGIWIATTAGRRPVSAT